MLKLSPELIKNRAPSADHDEYCHDNKLQEVCCDRKTIQHLELSAGMQWRTPLRGRLHRCMTSSWHLRGTIHQNQNQNQSEHRLRRGRRLSTRSQRTVREQSLSGIMFNWDRSYNHLLSCDSLQWCHLMMHAGELHSAECNQMISVRITRQTELQTHPINTLMLSRHASTFSWWKSHLQLMMVWKEETDSTQTVRSLQRRSLPHHPWVTLSLSEASV